MGIDIQRNMCHWKYLHGGRSLSAVCPVAYLVHNKGIQEKNTLLRGLLMSAGLLYGMINLLAFLLICNHYAMPMDKAFDLCYHELWMLSSAWHISYNYVNYVIFIILFLVLTLGNLLVAKCLSLISYKKEEN